MTMKAMTSEIFVWLTWRSLIYSPMLELSSAPQIYNWLIIRDASVRTNSGLLRCRQELVYAQCIAKWVFEREVHGIPLHNFHFQRGVGPPDFPLRD
jgi:hypothetical protein